MYRTRAQLPCLKFEWWGSCLRFSFDDCSLGLEALGIKRTVEYWTGKVSLVFGTCTSRLVSTCPRSSRIGRRALSVPPGAVGGIYGSGCL